MNYKQRRKSQASGSTTEHVVGPAFRGTTWRLAWSKEAPLETHVRLTGPIRGDGTDFEPWRFSDKKADFNDIIFPTEVFIGGSFKLTKFLAMEAFDRPSQTTVAHTFANAVRRMSQNDDRLFKMMKGQLPFVRPPRAVGLVQGILLKHGKYDFYGNPRLPVIVELSKSALNELEDLLDKQEADGSFTVGDPISADQGAVFNFYNKAAGKQEASKRSINWGKAESDSSGGAQREVFSYCCELIDVSPIPRGDDGKMMLVDKLFVPWKDALRIMDEREMVEAICDAYQDEKEILRVALERYQEYLPKFVLGERYHNVNAPAENTKATTEVASSPKETHAKITPPVRATKPKTAVNFSNAASEPQAQDNDQAQDDDDSVGEGASNALRDIANEQAKEPAVDAPPAKDTPPANVNDATLVAIERIRAMRKKRED